MGVIDIDERGFLKVCAVCEGVGTERDPRHQVWLCGGCAVGNYPDHITVIEESL